VTGVQTCALPISKNNIQEDQEMGYFSDFGQACLKEFFSLPPAQDLTGLSQEYLPYALGALLYMPASEPKILNSFQAKTVPFLVSAAICLEDAVRDSDVLGAEENLNVILEKFAQKKLRGETLPFIFIRVRNFEQLRKITQNTVFLSTLTGFILPKFSPQEGEKYFAYLQKLKEKIGKTLYALPI
jgi:hypothetical protein